MGNCSLGMCGGLQAGRFWQKKNLNPKIKIRHDLMFFMETEYIWVQSPKIPCIWYLIDSICCIFMFFFFFGGGGSSELCWFSFDQNFLSHALF